MIFPDSSGSTPIVRLGVLMMDSHNSKRDAGCPAAELRSCAPAVGNSTKSHGTCARDRDTCRVIGVRRSGRREDVRRASPATASRGSKGSVEPLQADGSGGNWLRCSARLSKDGRWTLFGWKGLLAMRE